MTITIRNYGPHPLGASLGSWASSIDRVFIAHREWDTSGVGPWKMWGGNTKTGQLSEGEESFATFAEAIAYAPRFYAEENPS